MQSGPTRCAEIAGELALAGCPANDLPLVLYWSLVAGMAGSPVPVIGVGLVALDAVDQGMVPIEMSLALVPLANRVGRIQPVTLSEPPRRDMIEGGSHFIV